VLRVFGALFSPSIATDSNLTSVEGTLDFTRRNFGCDWTFGTMQFDRSPREFAALLSEYAAGHR